MPDSLVDGTFVEVGSGLRLWTQRMGKREGAPLLLVMGANSSGMAWPGKFLAHLAGNHSVIRYDHRDTGRSSRVFDKMPYSMSDLAADAVAVLDALGIPAAHVVGMSMGGLLSQLLLLDYPERLLSATLFCAPALPMGDGADDPALPGPDPRLVELWRRQAEARDQATELDLRVEHWRLLNGSVHPIDEERYRRLEARLPSQIGGHGGGGVHNRIAQHDVRRGAELSRVTTPTLVIEAPEDPLIPPAHARWLAATIPTARLVSVPGMGHVLHPAVLTPLARAIVAHVEGS
ncbi:alpha/beta fold hydrolase [Streptomyces sp. NPDC127098]|uniref:alpha/beta fold hydrolase n=1 Tax=Streptomyces sp. NPDC127098 TaxID=3347137 RepID=UPI003655A44D